MSFPYVESFLALLVAYMGYSVWAGLDARYPIAAALALLVATAIVDASGNTAAANTLAEYVFFLLGAGVVLLLIDHVRDSRRRSSDPVHPSAQGESAQTAEPGERPTDQALDRVEQQPVPVVDAPGREYQEDEQQRDSQPEWDENEPGQPKR